MIKLLARGAIVAICVANISAARQDIGDDNGWVDPGMSWEEFQQTGFWQYEYDSTITGCYNFCLDGSNQRAEQCMADPKNTGIGSPCAVAAMNYYHGCNSWCQS